MSTYIVTSGAIIIRQPLVSCLVYWIKKIIIRFWILCGWLKHILFTIITHRKHKLGTSLVFPSGHDRIKVWTRIYIEAFLVACIVLVNVNTVYNRFQNTNGIVESILLQKTSCDFGKRDFNWPPWKRGYEISRVKVVTYCDISITRTILF